LLRAVVETVDKHGLKRRAMQEHQRDVDGYFEGLAGRTFASEAAEALRSRMLKYRDKLFTFIEHDGVPWNNNNAENAVKAFARYRQYAQGHISEERLGHHLVLLSLYQSCAY